MNNITNLKSINYFKQTYDFYKVNRANNLTVLYFNAISMRNKLDHIVAYAHSFYSVIHIIVISETGLYQYENNFFNIPNYIAYHSNRKENIKYGRGGGTVIYIHSSLSSSFKYEESNENKYHFLVVKILEYNLNIVSLYRSPKTMSEKQFICRLGELLSIYKKSVIIIIE